MGDVAKSRFRKPRAETPVTPAPANADEKIPETIETTDLAEWVELPKIWA